MCWSALVLLRKEAEVLKWKDGLRVGVGVAIFAIASVVFDYQDRLEDGRRDLHQWSQGCLWGAMTIIMVNFPVLGKIAKTSLERCLGTLVGGWLGCACFLVTRHPAWTAGISFIVAIFSSMLAVKLKLDYSCKLLTVTFILVLWTPQSDAQALTVAASRVTCIMLSVLLLGLLSVLIYPQAASEQVLGSLHRAMESTALLNRIVWEEVISKCREESFRISESFRLAKDAASTVLRGDEEPPGRAQSSLLTCAGSKQQSGPASPAVAASQGPEAAPMCIEDKALEGAHAADGLCTPQWGAIKLPVGPASGHSCAARGLDMPQPGAAVSWDKVAEDMPPAPQGVGPRMALRECTSGHSPVKSVFASKLSRPCASAAATPCRAPRQEAQHAAPEKLSGNGEAATAGMESRWCLPVCFPLPPRVHKGGGNASEEAEAKRQLDVEEEVAAERAALQLGFKGYADLEREEPFFDASTAVRTQQAAAEEALTTSLSEMYIGTWAGRRWYLPTVFYHNQAHGKRSWHMPEKVITRLAMRMRRVVRVLNMIHATFRDGFQKEVLEELEHHFPLDLLVDMSEAAIDTLQAFVDAFPKPHQPVTALMADTQLRRLRKVMDELLALAHTTRQHKVELILLGEELHKAVAAGSCADERELLSRLCALGTAGGPLDQGEELFLFPNTEAGWLATARWYGFHFLVQQLVEALCRLRITLNLMLPHLPGAHIAPDPLCQGDTIPTASQTAEQRRDKKSSTMHVVLEG
ncbi:g10115 [Coccomyxa elongata]